MAKTRPSVRRDISVSDMSAGLDLRQAPSKVHPSRARMLLNWSLREQGALVLFPGWRTHSTSSLGASRIQGGARVYLGNVDPFWLFAYSGAVKKPTDAGAWGSSVSTGWSTTTAVFFPYDRDLVAVFDGATAPKKSVDGTTWTNFGIAAPGTPTSAALAGGSLVSGNVYEFSYSGRDDALGHEGNESVTVQRTPSGGNLSVRLTLPFHADTQVDTLAVYGRDVTAGEEVRRRIGTVANPGSGSATYDVTSNSWGSGVQAPDQNTVPPLLSFGWIWKNRWWARHATIKNRLHFSEIFQPQSWPAAFYIDIPFDRGDEIAAGQPLGDTLVIFGRVRPYIVFGATSLDFEVRPAGAAQAGALGPRAVDLLEDGIVHAAAEGIYVFDGATDRLLSYDIDGYAPEAVGWRKYITTAASADLEKTPVIYNAVAKEVSIGVTNLSPYDFGGEWVLDLGRTKLEGAPAWTSTNRPVGGYVRWDGNEPVIGNRGRLFSWPQALGTICEERTGTTADGSEMAADWLGPLFTNDGLVSRVIDGAIEFEPHNGSFGMTLTVDNQEIGGQNVEIGGGTSVYGTAVYGTATYGGASRRRLPMTWPLTAEGLTFGLRAQYFGLEAFRWFTYRISVVPESQARGL